MTCSLRVKPRALLLLCSVSRSSVGCSGWEERERKEAKMREGGSEGVCKRVEKSDSEREAKRGRGGVGEGVRD